MRTFLKASAICVGVCFCNSAIAQDEPQEFSHERMGVAILGGTGPQFGGQFGAIGAFYVPVVPWFRLAPHAGGGATSVSDWGGNRLLGGWAAGISFAAGHRHAVILDATYGLCAIEESYLEDSHGLRTHTGAIPLYGVSTGAGYEYHARSGFLFRALIGPTFPRYADGKLAKTIVDVSVGIGGKF